MASGSFEGKDEDHPEIRRLFTRAYLLGSGWNHQRLQIKQQRDTALWQRHVAYLDEFIANPLNSDEHERLALDERRTYALTQLDRCRAPAYLQEGVSTLGADPLGCRN